FASTLAALIAVTIYLNIDNRIITIILVSIFMLRMIVEMYRRNSDPLRSISYEIFAICYTIIPMLLLFQMSSALIVALFIMVWSNDVGAYLVGVSCGKHKLWERLSPKKSWEGFFGGVIATIIAAVIIGINRNESPYIWAATAILVSAAAVYGDLFESMFKRSLKIKDSGNIIPGHGGVLDRFDAIFFAAPVFYIIYTYIF
ncbi:MAG: phosphatidate cytidylyltransferase, partial [Rikenellaceae bacterium]